MASAALLRSLEPSPSSMAAREELAERAGVRLSEELAEQVIGRLLADGEQVERPA